MQSPIAIVGYSCHIPGGSTISEGYDMIIEGINNIKNAPDDRLDIEAYFNPVPRTPDKIYCTRGGFVDDFNFDPNDFGMNPKQASDCDINQLLSLVKVRDALENAGISSDSSRKNMGCVLAIGGGQKRSYEMNSRLAGATMEKVLRRANMEGETIEALIDRFKAHYPDWSVDCFPGVLGNVTGGRCCNVFNLDGLNCVVDAACASSHAALRVAMDEISRGECRSMLVGGTCTDNSVGMFMNFSQTPVFTTDDSLCAYDSNSHGMLIGEGSVMFVIKSLENAIEDGDRVHCLIRSVGSSSDGTSSGIYAPVVEGQKLVLERALRQAGVKPSDVGLVEGHGTGTSKGDEVEIQALQETYASCPGNSIPMGSVKTQIGHLKAVAGFAGMLKAILALKHKILPGSINAPNPIPILTDPSTPLYLNPRTRPWFPKDPHASRMASISSFGFGGANYCAILEEYESDHTDQYREGKKVDRLFVLSSPDMDQLKKLCVDWITRLTTDVHQGFYELSEKHQNTQVDNDHVRMAFVAQTGDEARDILTDFINSPKEQTTTQSDSQRFYVGTGGSSSPRVAVLFPGQGSEYKDMFKHVAMNWPEFRKVVTNANKSLQEKGYGNISDAVWPIKDEDCKEEFSNTLEVQTAIAACSMGLYEILHNAGLRPDVASGHSLGELCALYSGGYLSNKNMCDLVVLRGEIMNREAPTNASHGMVAVMGDNLGDMEIPSSLKLTSVNSSKQIVLGGTNEAIDEFMNDSRMCNNYRVVKLKTKTAFHTDCMNSASEKFCKITKDIEIETTREGPLVYANTTGFPYNKKQNKAVTSELAKQISNPVRFKDSILDMYKNGTRIFIEVGPGKTLSRFVQDTLPGDATVVSLNPSPASSSKVNSNSLLYNAVARLISLGVNLPHWDKWSLPPIVPRTVTKRTMHLSAASVVSDRKKKNLRALMESTPDVSKGGCNATRSTQGDEVEKRLEQVNQLHCELLHKEEELRRREHMISAKEMEICEKERGISSLQSRRRRSRMFQSHHPSSVTPREQEATTSGAGNAADAIFRISEINNNTYLKTMKMLTTVCASSHPSPLSVVSHQETNDDVSSISQHEATPSQIVNMPPKHLNEMEVNSDVKPVNVMHELEEPLKRKDDEIMLKETTDQTLRDPVSVVIDAIASHTGYETEMIESSMDLECDLGIDSIKRVEILSTVQDNLDICVTDLGALAETRTVQDVMDFMIKTRAEYSDTTGGSPVDRLEGDTKEVPSLGIESPEVQLNKTKQIEFPFRGTCPIKFDMTSTSASHNTAPMVVFGSDETLLDATCKGLKTLADIGVYAMLTTPETNEDDITGFLNNFNHLKGCVILPCDTSAVELPILIAKNVHKHLVHDDGNVRGYFVAFALKDSDGKDAAMNAARCGSVTGLGKALRLEWPHAYCKATLIPRNLDVDMKMKIVLDELQCPSRQYGEIEYRFKTNTCTHPRRFVRVKSHSDCVPSSTNTVWNQEVLVVTGGARGITPHCVENVLAYVGKSTKVVILSRSSTGEIPDWAKGLSPNMIKSEALKYLKSISTNGKVDIKEHKRLTAEVSASVEISQSVERLSSMCSGCFYEKCDITDYDSVLTVLEKTMKVHGNITGIVHGAGVLRDKLVHKKSKDDVLAVWNTKVTGLLNIFESMDSLTVSNDSPTSYLRQLRLVVLFSSAAGLEGNPGQSDYAMANSALNEISLYLEQLLPECVVMSPCFGPWESGMVTDTLAAHFKSMGVSLIPLKEGAEVLSKRLFEHGYTGICSVGSWPEAPLPVTDHGMQMLHSLSTDDGECLKGHMIQGKYVIPATVICDCITTHVKMTHPGRNIMYTKNVKILSGISLSESELPKHICTTHILNVSSDSVECSATYNKNGQDVVCYQCTVEFSEGGSKIPSLSSLPAKGTGSEIAIYGGDTGLFHTGGMQMAQSAVISDDGNMIIFKCNTTSCPPNLRIGWIIDLLSQATLRGCMLQTGCKGIPNTKFINCMQCSWEMFPDEFDVYVKLTTNESQSCTSGEIWVNEPISGECVAYVDSMKMTYSPSLCY